MLLDLSSIKANDDILMPAARLLRVMRTLSDFPYMFACSRAMEATALEQAPAAILAAVAAAMEVAAAAAAAAGVAAVGALSADAVVSTDIEIMLPAHRPDLQGCLVSVRNCRAAPSLHHLSVSRLYRHPGDLVGMCPLGRPVYLCVGATCHSLKNDVSCTYTSTCYDRPHFRRAVFIELGRCVSSYHTI